MDATALSFTRFRRAFAEGLTPARLGAGLIVVLAFVPILANGSALKPSGSAPALEGFDLFALAIALWRATLDPNGSKSAASAVIALEIALICVGAALPQLRPLAEAACMLAGGAWLLNRTDPARNSKAAAVVLLSAASHAVLAPLVFAGIAPLILPLDASAAGWLLNTAFGGFAVHGTLITSGSDHAVAIREGCSSFHNVSLATLCWVTVTMMERPRWAWRDAVVGLGIVAVQIACNLARLFLISISLPMFMFWHEGLGRHFFAASATVLALLMAYLGTRWADRAPERRPSAGV